MLDQGSEVVPGLVEVVAQLQSFAARELIDFSALRRKVHQLELPAEIKLSGPYLLPEVVRIEVQDSAGKLLDTVDVPAPQAWRDSLW